MLSPTAPAIRLLHDLGLRDGRIVRWDDCLTTRAALEIDARGRIVARVHRRAYARRGHRELPHAENFVRMA
jgi:hypothetical protein